MEEFFRKVKKLARVATVGASLLASNAQSQTPEDLSKLNKVEDVQKNKDIIAGIELIESQFKNLSSAEISKTKPTFVIMAQSEVLDSKDTEIGKPVSDLLIAGDLEAELIGTEGIDFLSRDQSLVSVIQKEDYLENMGLITGPEIKEYIYTRPDAYIVISQKLTGDTLTFSAEIISLDTKKSEVVSVSGDIVSPEDVVKIHDDLSLRLSKLVQEKIKGGLS